MSNIHALEPQAYGRITLKTTFGNLDIELFTKQCPKATQNFVQLCLDGYYKGTVFERVEKDFIAIGGCHEDCDKEDDFAQEYFPDEFHSRLRFTRRGLLATANISKNENGPKFFFTLGPTPELQNKHTIFGRVIGNSIYCLVDLNECHVDEDDRPVRIQSIKEVIVNENPFPDLKPRKSQSQALSKDLSEATSSSNVEDIYDPINKPRPKKSKKLSFHRDDESDDSDEAVSNRSARIIEPKIADTSGAGEPKIKHEAPEKMSNHAKIANVEEPTLSDNSCKPSQSEDDKIVAKEKRLREIRAQIQNLKKQIERGHDAQISSDSKAEDRLEGSNRSSGEDISTSASRKSKGKSREKETIELVTDFRKELKEASKSRTQCREKPSKKTKIDHDIYAEEFAELDALDDDAWMTHRFEAED